MHPTAPRLPCRRLLNWAVLSGLLGQCVPLATAADPPAASAAAPPAAGHSLHGESFNEGPRQRAYVMQGTGPVKFPVTCTNPQVQEFINQGIGQLHGFWYFEAERSFRQAAALEPNCASAYWGMAMANTNNEKRAKSFIAEAVKRKTGITERETMYIDALDALYKSDLSQARNDQERQQRNRERFEAYAKALERILYKFPTDLEAKALLGLQLWLNRNSGSEIGSHLAVDALLKEVLAVEPMHPCHHYRIHLWDYEKADLALDSAARCGQAAPGIAHMWHMSGHIFSRLERYADAAWQQEASARVDHAYMMRDRIFPDQIHNYAHNNEWLIRDLAHVGRVRDAIDLAKNLSELPRHPQHNPLAGGKSAQFGRMRLFEELTRFELWDELTTLCETPYLEATDLPAEQIKRLRTLGAARFRKGDAQGGAALLQEIETRLLQARGLTAGAEFRPAPVARPSNEDGSPAPKSDAENQQEARARPLELAQDELRGHQAVSQGNFKAALVFLKRAGGVDPSYLARLEWQSGDKAEGLKSARAAVSSHKNQAQHLAALVELLWQSGENKEATERFAELRELAARADLDIPPFARLAPIAAALGYPADWRVSKPDLPDVGQRPPLDSLGPYRWSPTGAPDWNLTDASGQEYSLAQYRGRPVVLIFYLGYQCLHCAEQLQKFAPLTAEFQAAGISLLAVSTDDRSGLAKSLENYKSGVFPFPLTTDSGLHVFRSYRAFDDFEQKPLHGTFFIDHAGLVRWHDISHEPFQDAKFLLEEAKRLLSLSGNRSPGNVTGPGITAR
ncbi:MAG: redoxin domain-containing protein [Planctomycetales bacterium]